MPCWKNTHPLQLSIHHRNTAFVAYKSTPLELLASLVPGPCLLPSRWHHLLDLATCYFIRQAEINISVQCWAQISMHCLLISPDGNTTFGVQLCYLLPINTSISPVPSISRSLVHLSVNRANISWLLCRDHILPMSGLQAFIQNKFICSFTKKICWYPPQAEYYMLSIGVPLLLSLIKTPIWLSNLLKQLQPPCQSLLHHFNTKLFNWQSLSATF